MKRLAPILFSALLAGGGVTASAQDTNSAADQGFTTFEIIARNNIFDQSRTGLRDFNRPRRQPQIERLTLSGIGGGLGDAEAIFSGSGRSGDGLKVGDHVAGFVLAQITPDWVRLTNSTNSFVLDMDSRRTLSRVDDGPWVGSGELPDPVNIATNSPDVTAASPPGVEDASHPGESAIERKLRLRREQEEK